MMAAAEVQQWQGVARYLTPEDVATRLGVSISWVRKRSADGTLPHRKVGRYLRFIPSEIDAWVEKQH